MEQKLTNSGEHGHVIVVCQDGPSIALSSGESATVYLHQGKFYHREQTWWRRLARRLFRAATKKGQKS